MPHTYLLFDFSTDEEKAQQARHKLETWKQAFRLDKKLLYKFDRSGAEEEIAPAKTEGKPAKTKASAKGKGKSESKTEPTADESAPDGPVRLLVRLAFSGHEKLSEQRWIDRIPTEEPFQTASPAVVKANDANFAETEKQFEDLA